MYIQRNVTDDQYNSAKSDLIDHELCGSLSEPAVFIAEDHLKHVSVHLLHHYIDLSTKEQQDKHLTQGFRQSGGEGGAGILVSVKQEQKMTQISAS